MPPLIGVIGAGMMGSGVGQRLAENHLEVRTPLAGRSPDSIRRAAEAFMIDSSDEEIATCDVILSIVPPGQAVEVAQQWAPVLGSVDKKPLFVDCNAVSPVTAAHIDRIISAAGVGFVDGGIIGGPPTPGSPGPRIYVSGELAAQVASLSTWGLDVRIQPGPVGAASAMKLSYAGIVKGFIALGAIMALAASRAGTVSSLQAELSTSQPELYAWLSTNTPGMYSKAHRWVAEMEQIGQFAGEDLAAISVFDGAANLYEQLAADFVGDRSEISQLDDFLSEQ